MISIVPKTFRIKVALMDHKDHRITEETITQFHQVFGHHENLSTNLVENVLFPSAPGDYRVNSGQKLANCFAPANYLFVALDGRASICCQDQDVLHSLGNVGERSIREVWFDPANQTTFRNVALGVDACPDTCTKKCVLAMPRQDIETVRLGVGVPFQEAARFGDILLMNNQLEMALPIVHDLVLRDPENVPIRKVLEDIRRHMQPKILPH